MESVTQEFNLMAFPGFDPNVDLDAKASGAWSVGSKRPALSSFNLPKAFMPGANALRE